MAQSSRILFNHNLKRCFNTTTLNLRKHGGKQQNFMNKLMKRDATKRIWYQSKNTTMPGPITAQKLISSHAVRRMAVLNNLFMSHITDLMATGEASSELLGRNIEVSRVKITPDFQTVLVYWAAKNDDKQFQTEKILNDCAFRLRHELEQLRVVGQVPLVKFVRDKQLQALAELEKRLKIADYGEDYEPTEPENVPKQELTLNMSLSPEVREKILQLKDEEVQEEEEEEEDEDDENEFDLNLPEMRHDVLGLDQYAIMTRVKQSLKKSHDASKNRLPNVFSILPEATNVPIDLSTFNAAKNESTAFTNFLVKRQLEERLKLRREKRDSILAYNLELENYETQDGNYEELPNDEKDIDVLDDINLGSIK